MKNLKTVWFVLILTLASAILWSVHIRVLSYDDVVVMHDEDAIKPLHNTGNYTTTNANNANNEKVKHNTTKLHDQLSDAVQTLGAERIWNDLLQEGPAAWLAQSSSPATAARTVIIMEVGMHSAKQCVQAAEMTGLPVHCYEPSPQSFARVQRSVPAMASSGEVQSRIFLYNQAASSTSQGTLPFKTSGGTGDHVGSHNMWTMEKETITNNTETGYQILHVPQVRLDDFVSNVDLVFLIKIDTQGFEPSVFSGLYESIRYQKIHYLLFEYWPKGMDFLADRLLGECQISVEQILKPLLQAGYRLYALAVAAHPKAPVGWTIEIPRRPLDTLQNHCLWYYQVEQLHPSGEYKMGYWSDILAVSPMAPVMDNPSTDVGRALMQDRLKYGHGLTTSHGVTKGRKHFIM